MKVYIDTSQAHFKALRYIFLVFCKNKNINPIFVDNVNESEISIDPEASENILFIDKEFYTKIFLKKEKVAFHEIDYRDKLTQAFYLINSLDEHFWPKLDSISRYSYSSSLQYKNKNILSNHVQLLFDEVFEMIDAKINIKHFSFQSRVFLSHDVDNINGGWKEDGFAALKTNKYGVFFKLLIKHILQQPHWLTIDKIMKIHDEYDLKSTFFWIVNQGKSENGLFNADYNFSSEKIKKERQKIETNGFENALHKSVSEETFKSEINKFGHQPFSNRNHYLRFNLPDHYRKIEESRIKVDCSLGFAEHFGFRNNYGQPFQPYDIFNNKSFSFVEMPLHVMDRTFYNYLKTPVNKVAEQCIQFIENNKINCVLSILWHNNFFESIKYAGYLEEYKKILFYLYESKIRSISTKEIFETYKIN
jgi:hypothetical protein